MAYIDLNTYIFTPATIFDLQGGCRWIDADKGVPCRIKVGPHRWLTEQVNPEKLSVTLWQEQAGRITFLQNEPVQTFVDKQGVLTLDMVAFARDYFGKDHVSFCSSDTWQWHKHNTSSDTFLATAHGLAAHRESWLDISIHHSDLYLTPGTLALCGHDVYRVYWDTFCDTLGAPGKSMRPLIENLLSAPHSLSAEDFMQQLNAVSELDDEGFNHLAIRTHRGEFRMGVSLDRYLQVHLNGAQPLEGYAPNPKNSIREDLHILLQMMQAADFHEAQAKAEALLAQGLLMRRKES